jgi:hypothetical protein
VPTAVVIDGVRIHDQRSEDLDCQHVGGLMVVSADGLVIRNSRWSRAAVYDIEVGDFTHGRFGNPRHVLIEGNWFGAPVGQDGRTNDGQAELQVSEGGEYNDWELRGNHFVNGPALNFDGGATLHNVHVVDNVGTHPNCENTPGVQWSGNRWIDPPCSAADRRIRALPYADARPGVDDLSVGR